MVKTSKLVVASNKRLRKHKRVLKGYKNHFSDTTIEWVYEKLVGLGSDGQLEKTCDILDFAQHDATGNPFKVGDFFMSGYSKSCAQGYSINQISRVVRVTQKTCFITGFEGYNSYAGNRNYETRPYRVSKGRYGTTTTALWYSIMNSMLWKCPDSMVSKIKQLGDNIIGKEDFLVKGTYNQKSHQFEMMYRCDCDGFKK